MYMERFRTIWSFKMGATTMFCFNNLKALSQDLVLETSIKNFATSFSPRDFD
jgi:hypothetical protein